MGPNIRRHPYVAFLSTHPALARFWAGSLLSALGDTLAWTTLIWYVVDRAGGGPAVAVLLLVQAIPGMLSAPLFGRWLDHGPLRSILYIDNAARAVVTAALPIMDQTVGLPLPVLFVAVGILGTLSPATRVGTGVAVPRLCRPEDRTTANALFAAADPVATVAGPALSGLLISRFGVGAALWCDAATFVAMLWAVAALPGKLPAPRSVATESDVRFGAGKWLLQPLPLVATGLSALFFFTYGPTETALPIFIKQTLHSGAATFGAAWSAVGVGAAFGGMAAVPLARIRRSGRLLAAGMVAWGLISVGVSRASTPNELILLYFAGGVVWGPYLPLRATLMQRCVPEDRLGSVLGIQSAVLAPTMPLGAALGGALLTRYDAGSILLGVGISCLIGAAAAACVPALHRPDPEDRVIESSGN
ncbi:MAG: MFS transporter [Armatimonadota bacterium]